MKNLTKMIFATLTLVTGLTFSYTGVYTHIQIINDTNENVTVQLKMNGSFAGPDFLCEESSVKQSEFSGEISASPNQISDLQVMADKDMVKGHLCFDNDSLATAKINGGVIDIKNIRGCPR